MSALPIIDIAIKMGQRRALLVHQRIIHDRVVIRTYKPDNARMDLKSVLFILDPETIEWQVIFEITFRDKLHLQSVTSFFNCYSDDDRGIPERAAIPIIKDLRQREERLYSADSAVLKGSITFDSKKSRGTVDIRDIYNSVLEGEAKAAEPPRAAEVVPASRRPVKPAATASAFSGAYGSSTRLSAIPEGGEVAL